MTTVGARIAASFVRPEEDLAAAAARYTRPNGAPRARFLVLVGCLSIFGPLCIDMYLPSLPKIAVNLGASASEIQLSLTACLIGIALGQLLYGSVSDQFGRRSPLMFGLALFIVASLCCAFAPDAAVLAVFRFFQGFGGAAGVVISRAIVRDFFEGKNAARAFSMLMIVTACGPVLAPQLGAFLLDLTSWRGIFISLAIVSTVLLVIAAFQIPESLAPKYRSSGGLEVTLQEMRRVGTSVTFLQHALAASLGFGAIFAYVSGASFTIENIFHASPQLFGALFALNGLGLITGSQLNARLLGRYSAHLLMTCGLVALAVSATGLLVLVIVHVGGLTAISICMFGTMISNGFIAPNATALSLQHFPDAAGSASALLGFAQFGMGALIAPLVGLGGSHDALPMGLAMATLGMAGLSARFLLTRYADPGRRRTLVAAPH